ncbi:protein OXIDATIVE STRESS 3 LIKE 1 [Salvia miltiorrhiza]|uniref:protein OXIDATIVE STRESS 3 LIKE 1 n=1 Tax=Salvia miltiorrhiza TaxID=226208 RepID=UPI0025AD7DDE|nr:protein OXIDATIVE STRESS 3 LIKE 1 [Salvia miltiorrhiza]
MPTRVMNKDGGFVHGISEIYGGDQRFLVEKKVMFKDVREGHKEEEEEESGKIGLLKNNSCKNISCSDESSSSIGKNSDLSENSLEKSGDGEEVQSSYKGPLNAMKALEEVLPIRRGISRFYNGKSKSFASLGEASSSSSIKEIAKPENAYMRKRRNLLASNLVLEKTRGSPLRGNGGGISKSSAASRTTLALAVAMSNSESQCNSPGGSSSPRNGVAISNSNPNGMALKPSG